jgi:hypothetical protein
LNGKCSAATAPICSGDHPEHAGEQVDAESERGPRVVGHLGEALPFWLYRLDYMKKPARPAIRNGAASLGNRICEYLKEHVYITTSGTWRGRRRSPSCSRS